MRPDEWDRGKFAMTYSDCGRFLVAYLRKSAEMLRSESYWDLVVVDAESRELLLEYKQIDRAEYGMPCHGMKVFFSDQGRKIGCSVNNRLLILDLQDP